MALEPRTSLVPFHQANPETKSAYLKGLQRQGLDDNPEAWHCTRCDQTTSGNDILISYDVGDTPIPYCPNCMAYGPELHAAAAA
jgi:hypothetical protein